MKKETHKTMDSVEDEEKKRSDELSPYLDACFPYRHGFLKTNKSEKESSLKKLCEDLETGLFTEKDLFVVECVPPRANELNAYGPFTTEEYREFFKNFKLNPGEKFHLAKIQIRYMWDEKAYVRGESFCFKELGTKEMKRRRGPLRKEMQDEMDKAIKKREEGRRKAERAVRYGS